KLEKKRHEVAAGTGPTKRNARACCVSTPDWRGIASLQKLLLTKLCVRHVRREPEARFRPSFCAHATIAADDGPLASGFLRPASGVCLLAPGFLLPASSSRLLASGSFLSISTSRGRVPRHRRRRWRP